MLFSVHLLNPQRLNLWLRTRGFTKQTLKMNTAFFRHVDGDERFHVSILYVNTELEINKQLNFCRTITETSTAFLNRLDCNINKILERKNSKRIKKGKLPDNEGAIKQTEVKSKLLLNGSVIDEDILCRNILGDPSNYCILILGIKLPIVVNAPWIANMVLPKSTMAGFIVYPMKLESFFINSEASIWNWFRSKKANGAWELCGSGQMYETVNEDVGHFLRLECVPKSYDGRTGPATEAVSADVVEASPGPLPCESRHSFTSDLVDDTSFRIVSYNVLADIYVDSEYSRTVLFGYCPVYALSYTYRRQLLTKEILGYNADIISLQEVDTKTFKHDLLPVLETKGMSGCFSQKGTVVNEGTAIFFNLSKFKLLESRSLLLNDLLQNDPICHDLYETIKLNPAFCERVMGRSTTLQICLLESVKRPNQLLLVANIHLYFHPDADHVRLFQAGLTVMYLEAFINQERARCPDKTLSLVWCGDFNSVPECGIYELLTTGSVSESNIDWRSKEEEAVSGVSLSHNLRLASACGTPPFTNYTVGFKACLDYIFYDRTNLLVRQVVPFPSEEELSAHLAIPSIVFPSDHIALVSDLQFIS